jgi:hypothetical protein
LNSSAVKIEFGLFHIIATTIIKFNIILIGKLFMIENYVRLNAMAFYNHTVRLASGWLGCSCCCSAASSRSSAAAQQAGGSRGIQPNSVNIETSYAENK